MEDTEERSGHISARKGACGTGFTRKDQDMTEKFKKLKEYIERMNNYRYVTSLLYWDMDTNMPEKGFEKNSAASAFFSTEAFKMGTAPELRQMLDELKQPAEYEQLDSNEKFIVDRMLIEFERDERVPVEFYTEYVMVRNESEHAWQEAKQKDDFSIFAPKLEKMIEMTKRMYGYRKPDMELYEAMLDEYEPGMDSATIDRVFGELKAALVPLIRKIAAKGSRVNPKFDRKYDLNEQRELQKVLLSYIGFDWSKGNVGETEHPFTLNFSSQDVRVSNHFREDNAIDPMFSAIHEGGHAIFEQNVDPVLDGTVAGSCNYMGIHESQSRFFENILGRNKNFWAPIYPKVQGCIKELSDVSLDEFYREINRVECGMIRTMSDEVTYCLHIILRYEMEKLIIRENVNVNDLPRLWNEKMQELLGLTPGTDAEGVLQDMHWSDGSFGYFPSYLLGNVYDGMYIEAIEKELGSIDTILAEGRILDITHWLNEKIHKYGSTRFPKEVLKAVCGKEATAEPIIRYFTGKYTKLYEL